MREYLETCSNKSILSNSVCDLANIILKEVLPLGPSSPLHILTCL